jgi:hypothetical protein
VAVMVATNAFLYLFAQELATDLYFKKVRSACSRCSCAPASAALHAVPCPAGARAVGDARGRRPVDGVRVRVASRITTSPWT